MNVLVLSNMTPFLWGGAEELAVHLVRQLRLRGAKAEVMRLPFTWNPPERLIEEMALCRSLRLANADRVIALKFPTYLVPHDNKVLWVLHQFRQAYDLWDAGQSNIPDTDRGREIRRIIRTADNACFAESRRLFCLSATTQARMRHYNDVTPSIMWQPLNDPELFGGGDYGNYILASGRVNFAKRQWLLVEAMRHVRSGLRLVIAGPPDGPEDEADLRRRAAGLEDRVALDLRFLPRAELAALVNGARAVAYLPYDEDSVGYVTAEAFHAARPVVTVSDAGGLLEIVRPDETGMVCAPEPAALAAAIDSLGAGADKAAELGRAARALWLGFGVSWPATIERLLS